MNNRRNGTHKFPCPCKHAPRAFAAATATLDAIFTHKDFEHIQQDVFHENCELCSFFYTANVTIVCEMILHRLEELHPEIGQTLDRIYDEVLMRADRIWEDNAHD